MLRLTSLLLFGLLALGSGNISAPIPPTEVASFDLIVADLELKVNSLTELLAEEEKFETQQEKIVRAGGVIACLSQAAIEHDDFAQAKFAAPALRDAAIELQSAEDHAAAVAVAQTIKQAWQGVSTGEHAKEHEWSELVSMYDLMEEMNDRNGGLSRSLRRSRGKVEEQLNASTNAVLAIAMLADHNYVSEEADAKEWDQLSKDYQQAMTSLIKAIQEKDQAKIGEFYKAGNRACDTCHEKFRD